MVMLAFLAVSPHRSQFASLLLSRIRILRRHPRSWLYRPADVMYTSQQRALSLCVCSQSSVFVWRLKGKSFFFFGDSSPARHYACLKLLFFSVSNTRRTAIHGEKGKKGSAALCSQQKTFLRFRRRRRKRKCKTQGPPPSRYSKDKFIFAVMVKYVASSVALALHKLLPREAPRATV